MKNEEILKIENLHAKIGEESILKNLNLTINRGEIHAIMGKNGSGKSTLAKVISGHPSYKIKSGNILFKSENINDEEPDERARKGIFLGFQYPVEVSGVTNIDFLRLAYNARQKKLGHSELDPLAFFELINEKIKKINMDSMFLSRNLNEGFSGGEKKKNEILQMSLLKSELCILDEIDSGLDIDALKSISKSIKDFADCNSSIILITHYQRLLDYIQPDYIHIMSKGKIVLTGDKSIALSIEKYGYDELSKHKNYKL